ncbi:hypothetical protein DPV78_003592 [Talaromyces pinophilus]|nr:hypothetical protein DPV78_003592 [Talaromyces pinophilus]
MKQIALLALQKVHSDDDNESEDVASDGPLKGDGAAKLRGSMSSVLDDDDSDFLDEAKDGIPSIVEEDNTSSVDSLDLEDNEEAGMTSLRTEMSYRKMTPETFDKMLETMIDQNMLTASDYSPPRSYYTAGTKRFHSLQWAHQVRCLRRALIKWITSHYKQPQRGEVDNMTLDYGEKMSKMFTNCV